MTEEKILSLDNQSQFGFVYPAELHALEEKGAPDKDIAAILTGRATVNEIRSKLQLAPLPFYGADKLFIMEPAAVIREFRPAVFDPVREYWLTAKTEAMRDFWQQIKDAQADSAKFMLGHGVIGQDVYDFLTAD